MKKAGFLITIPLLLLSAHKAFANESSVHITSEGNASATVEVNNSFNSTNSTNSTNTTKTNIRIESNGEVKEYNSDSGEDVVIESSDGNSKVRINNDNTVISATPTPEQQNEPVKPTKDLSITQKPKTDQQSFFEIIKDVITNFFKNLF